MLVNEASESACDDTPRAVATWNETSWSVYDGENTKYIQGIMRSDGNDLRAS